ncbi:MAG: aminopeptidase P N-terminal domain-containing protein [Candidatus Babeliaceae bacterium]
MKNTTVFKTRRQELLQKVHKAYPDQQGVIVLFGSFEQARGRFRQESSFYYYAGIEEPGAVLIIDWSGKTTVLLPNHGTQRSQWMPSAASADEKMAQIWGVDDIRYLGALSSTYYFSPLFSVQEYEHFLRLVDEWITKKITAFTLIPSSQYKYVEQQLIIERLVQMNPLLRTIVHDVSDIVAHMRRKKSKAEIEIMYKAVEITMIAQEAAARVIESGKNEREIQAGIEYIFTEHGATNAFPSIVASGKNSTILHYNINSSVMKDGDLVVVDIGAEYDYYCADLTRTYPVRGTFSKRQSELYDKVLETQHYIADRAQPGYWLNNKEQPDKSLQHLAQTFLKEQGYDKYFMHGIGHYLGLDVHDVGSLAEPLQEGDVITIEPGIYIAQENSGIRIEDNYWIVQDGAVCLSEQLPKERKAVEKMAQQEIDEDDEYEDMN